MLSQSQKNLEMRKQTPYLLLFFLVVLTANCAGIRYITIDTREPGRIDWIPSIETVVVVNNTVQQPDYLGHSLTLVGQPSRTAMASSENLAFIYTEALAQFIDEEEHFYRVLLYHLPIRTDNNFSSESPLSLGTMATLLRESGADAIISLDRLYMSTNIRATIDQQHGFFRAELIARKQSTIRVYNTDMGGIPSVHYTDSLIWRGNMVQGVSPEFYMANFLPSRTEAMQTLAVRAAERMSQVLSPHWVTQERWFYTTLGARMREGGAFARANQWERALDNWKIAYNSARRAARAKAANNIALAYEMVGDLDNALEWATLAYQLFEQYTTTNSLERRRSLLLRNELQRRVNVRERLMNMME